MKHLIIISGLLITANIFAQNPKQVPIKQGKNGVYILLSDKGFSDKNPLYGKYTSVTIQRAVNDDKFREIGKVKPAASAEEFEKMIAKDALLSIASLKKLASKQDAWKYVQTHPDIKDYGLLALELNLGAALGAYFNDNNLADIKPGSVIKYKIILSNGKETAELSASVNAGEMADLQKPFLITKTESDSVINIQWACLSSKSADVMFGNIYTKEGNPAEFKFMQRVFANKDEKSDTVRFEFTHFVRPGIQYQYYIKPATMAIQEGPSSDTVIATSVNFSTLDQPEELKAKDSTNGIFLSWKLPQKTNARKSIIIERTSDINRAFTTIATLPSTALSYLDFSVQPSFSYDYRVRIATIANTVLPPSAHVSAKHRLKSFSPEAPQNITAKIQNNALFISWDKVANPDVAGYFVARNNGMDTLYENVSLLIKENKFLDTSKLYGRNNYTYAVRTYTYSDMSSAWNYSPSIQVNNNIKPLAPNGGRSYTQPGLVHLNWNDTKKSDDYISAYKVYRKIGNAKTDKLISVSDLTKAGFDFIAKVESNDFTDKLISSDNIQYAVTSTDVFGKESDIGFIQSVKGQMPYIAVPEQFSVRKTSKGVVIDWDIVKQDGVKSYNIYKRSAVENTAVKVTTVDITKGSYTDTNVKSGVLYYYSLSATGEFGTSAISAERFVKY